MVIVSRFLFSRKILGAATFEFCNTIGGIADMAGLAAGSTWSRMTQLRH